MPKTFDFRDPATGDCGGVAKDILLDALQVWRSGYWTRVVPMPAEPLTEAVARALWDDVVAMTPFVPFIEDRMTFCGVGTFDW